MVCLYTIKLLLELYFNCLATRQRQTSGTDVVKAVIEEVEAVFGSGNHFLRRIAFVESRDGTDPNTYRPGYHGGIWQVDEQIFLHTQSTLTIFMDKHEEIKKCFGINWLDVQWNDLRTPLYSGLAARLSLCVGPQPIPCTIVEQAIFWKKYYNIAYFDANCDQYYEGDTIKKFLEDAEILTNTEGKDNTLISCS